MAYPLPLLNAIILPLGMLSGLTASATVALFLIFLLIQNRSDLKFNISNFKLEGCFISWCFICCFLTPSPQKSLVTFLEVFSLVSLGLLLKNSLALSKYNQEGFKKALSFGIATAIILFFTEYFSQGIIFQTFRSIFQPNSSNIYYLSFLDRGCALLSLSSWVLTGILLGKRKYMQALCFYALIFSILYLSDSLASLIGFACAGLLLIFGRFISTKFFRLTTIILLIGSISFPMIVRTIDPYKISDEYSKILPDSAKHRLFIWNFIANRSEQKPWTGAGFAASKQYEVHEHDMVNYKQYRWSPLPLHPHSNILQIIFELGAVGFILFLGLVFKNLNRIENLIQADRDYACVSYVCFINYYVIGMISFSIWQTWWVASGVWVAVMLSAIGKFNFPKNTE